MPSKLTVNWCENDAFIFHISDEICFYIKTSIFKKAVHMSTLNNILEDIYEGIKFNTHLFESQNERVRRGE